MKMNDFYLRNLSVKNTLKTLVMAFFTLLSNLAIGQSPCNDPINPTLIAVDDNSGTISWEHPNPSPWYGYDYWYTSIQGYAPTSSTTPSGNTSSNNVTLSGYVTGATIYVFIRSRCGSETGVTPGPWRGPIKFTTIPAGSGCPVAPYGLSPTETFTPQYTQLPEVISSNSYAGEFSKVEVMPNRQYVFETSVSSDYITITDINSTSIIAHGSSPLTWNSTTTGTIRYYINTNSSCGVQQTERIRYITAKLIPSSCLPPINLTTSSITSTGAVLNWNFSGSFNQCQYYYSTNNITPNINATPSGTVASDNKVTLSSLSPNTTYYYWIRSYCNPDLSDWVFGGSFTTQATVVTGCVSALYGQNPSTVFTPACSGSPEIISTNMWAGEYSLVNVLPNKVYTFTSTVGTDFITIRDNNTSVAYASGTTPLVWSSGANTTTIKFFLHLNSTCGSQNVNRTTKITCQNAVSCSAPGSVSFSSVTSSSAIISWVAANPSPSNGYQYYYSTSSNTPSASATPSGSTSATTLNLSGLLANTTYYFWVRSNCGTTQSNWVFGNSFNTVGAGAGCTTATYGQYPTTTFTPTCFGNNEVIVTDAFAGEYSVINISANTSYTFTSSVASDYITITNTDASITYIAGTTPLQWSSGVNTGSIRYYIHASSACASQGTNRTKYIACQSSVPCGSPTTITVLNITSTVATISWTEPSPSPSGGYQYYFSTNNTTPNASTVPSGNSVSNTVILNNLQPNTVYYFWLRSDCGTSQSGWVSGGSFTTQVSTTFCNTATYGQFPLNDYTPACTGSAESIVTNAYAGEYTNVIISANTTYTFSSSIPTDYITITNQDGGVLLANGLTPLNWNSGSTTGIIRYYLHTDSACGSQGSNRIRYITCNTSTACSAPTLLVSQNITSNSAQISFTPSTTSGATYDVYFSTSSTAPTAITTPSGNISTTLATLTSLTSSTTYYFWVRSNCGNSNSSWVSGGSFTTNSLLSCNGASYNLYPSTIFTPSCSGSSETIVTDAYAGEFSKVATVTNKQYTFSSSKNTDFITITNSAGTSVLTSGTTPLIWNSGSYSGDIRYYIHANSACSEQNVNRIRYVSCTNSLQIDEQDNFKWLVSPNPFNDRLSITGDKEIDKVEIINSIGQLVKVFLADSSNLQLDLSDCSSGIYFLKIFSKENVGTYRLVKY